MHSPTSLILNEPPHGDQLYVRDASDTYDPQLCRQQSCRPQVCRPQVPGVPYSRDATDGGVRLCCRVQILGCPGCGAPLKLVPGPKKLWRCGVAECHRTWHLQIVREPGGKELLALVTA